MSEHLVRCWESLVQKSPAALAIVDGTSGRNWTRAELADAAADWQRAQPAEVPLTGRRVVLAEPNGVGWFQVFLGLLQSGAIPVPADPTEPLDNLRSLARGIRASFLWRDGRLEPVAAERPLRNRETCLIKLTSGSTGTPKALPFTHAQMIADGRQICASMDIRPGDLNLAIIPLGHSYGLGNLVVPLLEQGTPLIAAASPLPHALAEDCARWRPTVFPTVPTLLQLLLRSSVDAAKFASLRLVISAGAPLAPAVAADWEKLTGLRVHGFYGSTETGGITYDRSGDATLTGRSAGTPLEGVRLHAGRGRRFVVESAAVTGKGRHRPPDYGTINDAGELVLLGRSGRMVKIAGRRLNLAEVESALLGIPGVRAACAAAVPGAVERVGAVIETDLPAMELRAQLAQRIAAWKIPDRLLALRQVPVTARGKLDRRRAVALLAEARPARE